MGHTKVVELGVEPDHPLGFVGTLDTRRCLAAQLNEVAEMTVGQSLRGDLDEGS